MNISTLDISIIVVYLIAIFIFGLYLSRKEGSEGYFVNNRKTKLIFLIFTSLSTSIGAGTVLGVASAGFQTGISFGIIFIWFGILKPLGLSAAEPLVLKTVVWLPFFEPTSWLNIIGWWEVLIGITFLFKVTTRIAIGLLFLQMAGTFIPLFTLTDITFQNGSFWLPTMEGQYIIKNLMIISGALVIGGRIYNIGR